MPLVSVIVPTYNRCELAIQAIESVFAQTFKDYELIVVDDGSTDGTSVVMKGKYGDRIRFVRQENRGISGARNRGIEMAQGKYVAFLDSDDLWLPEKLAKQVEYLEKHPGTALVCTKLYRYDLGYGDMAEKTVCPPGFPETFEDLLAGPNYIPTTTVMVRRDVLTEVGAFDPALAVAEDWDLWLRIFAKHPIHCLPDVLAEHRDHGEKTTRNMVKVYEGFWHFYSKIHASYAGRLADAEDCRRKSISFLYLLGTQYLKKGEARLAFAHISEALKQSWSIGTYFAKERTFPALAKGFVKPYAAFLVSYFGLVKAGISGREN